MAQNRRGPRPKHTLYGVPASAATIGRLAGGMAPSSVQRRLAKGETAEEIVERGRGQRRRCLVHTLHGRPVSVAEIAALAGLSSGTVGERLRRGDSPEDIVATRRVRHVGHGSPRHALHGRPMTLAEIGALVGLTGPGVRLRILRGETPEEIVQRGRVRKRQGTRTSEPPGTDPTKEGG